MATRTAARRQDVAAKQSRDAFGIAWDKVADAEQLALGAQTVRGYLSTIESEEKEEPPMYAERLPEGATAAVEAMLRAVDAQVIGALAETRAQIRAGFALDAACKPAGRRLAR